MNEFSIVIVTYGRNAELANLISSIQGEIKELKEILIIDNHEDKIAAEIQSKFLPNRRIRYVHNSNNSLTAGRKIGAELSESEIVLFLDDDVTLEPNYLRNMLEFYREYPDANGMQGVFDVGPYSKTKNIFNRLFWLFNYSKNEYKVYPSVQGSYASHNEEVQECEWFSGTNFSYRRKVLDHIDFDLNLIKYCEGEDIDYSFRAHKKFGGLYVQPRCQVVHHAVQQSRVVGEQFMIMQEIYGYYLFKKLFPFNLKNVAIYLLSRIGKMILYIVDLLTNKKDAFQNLRYYIKSILRSILNNDLDQFNREIR